MAGKVWAIAYEMPGDDYGVALDGALHRTEGSARERLASLGFRETELLAGRRASGSGNLPPGTMVGGWVLHGADPVGELVRSIPGNRLFRAWDWERPEPHGWAVARIVELDLPDAGGDAG